MADQKFKVGRGASKLKMILVLFVVLMSGRVLMGNWLGLYQRLCGLLGF